MIKWLISLMMACSLSFTVSACSPDDSPKNTENTVPEPKPEPNPNPTPEPTPDNGMFDLSKGENGNPPTLLLSSRYEMPIVGLAHTAFMAMYVLMPSCPLSNSVIANSIRRVSMVTKRKSVKLSALAVCLVKNCSFARNSIRTSLPMQKRPSKNHCANSISVTWI